MKTFFKTLSLIVVIGLTGFLLGQNYPNAFKQHTRTTVIQTGSSLGNPNHQHAFFVTNLTIKSDKTILKAINDYRLDELWKTDKNGLLNKIRKQLEFRQVKGSNLIELKTSADDDEKAQQIAYAIVMAYQARKIKSIEGLRNEIVKKYKEKIQFQEDQVAENRKKLYEISKRLGIPLHGESSDKKSLSAGDFTAFGKAKDEYERELKILQSIKQKELGDETLSLHDSNPFEIHESGWSEKIATMMEGRKK